MNELRCQVSGKLMRVGRLRHQILENTIADLGILPSQHHVLMQLSRAQGAFSQAEIAERMHVSPASVARTIKSLDADGYIRRDSCGADGRRNEIRITERGERVLSQSRARFQKLDAANYAGFSEAELRLFSELLDRLTDNLMQMEEEIKGR